MGVVIHKWKVVSKWNLTAICGSKTIYNHHTPPAETVARKNQKWEDVKSEGGIDEEGYCCCKKCLKKEGKA
ncbi:MAG: hypothetical protein M0P69_07370 [Bacteroidales bacterium]|jgi:hypothetical protein|nr:hypothetical protein [Bacteroidales bacterium]